MIAFGGRGGGAPLVAALAAVLGLMAMPALGAGDPAIARAVDVRPEATAVFGGATIVLSAADDLFEGQKIVTGPQGQVQIVFADDTHMVVGPGSSLVIEKYLMRSGGTASAFAVSALGGTFRFITGKSAKNVYKIDTPTGTIGVRGTKFDFTVKKKKTHIILFDGEVTYCQNNGDCQSVTGKCDIVGSDSGEFIYVTSQRTLKTGFKINGAGECGASEPAAAKSEPKQEPATDPGPSKPAGKPDPLPDPLP